MSLFKLLAVSRRKGNTHFASLKEPSITKS